MCCKYNFYLHQSSSHGQRASKQPPSFQVKMFKVDLFELLIDQTLKYPISVSDASDKMSGVFGLGSDIVEMISGGLGFSLWY